METMEEGLAEVPETGAEEQEQQPIEGQEPEQQEGESDNKFSKRFTSWLKSQRDGGDPEVAKFARYAKDNEGRLFSLKQLEPKGIDGIREKYAALDGVMHGELKGIDAIGAIQDQIRDYEQSDELLASGNPKVLDLYGDEFNDGLGKLTPAILDRVQQSNPEAYAAAILPHLVGALRSSPLIQDFNGLVDILNEQPPQWLTPEQKQHFINDKFQKIMQRASGMSTWLNAQDNAVKDAGKRGEMRGNAGKQPVDKISQERQQLETRERDFHWKTNISPNLDKHAEKSFGELFRPYNQRLKLDAGSQGKLQQDFVQRVVSKAAANKSYMDQIQRYRQQKNPDPNTVLNLARVEFDKHSKSVMQEIINERYKSFLNGGKTATTTTNGSVQKTQTAPSGITYVSVKPPMGEIDHKNTPIDWIHQRKFLLRNGKTVQVRN